MAAVDFCPVSVMETPAACPASGEFSCTACSQSFISAAELRAHCKSERHVYNTKRKLAGLKPISQEVWERKLLEARLAANASKGTAHLKTSKSQKGGYPGEVDGEEGLQPPEAPVTLTSSAPKEEEPLVFSPRQCLFDRRHFETIEDNLKYMWKTYNFSIPDREYCTNVEGLLKHVWCKCTEEPYACLFCNRRFPDAGSVRRHMFDKKHSRIGTEARTRRGNPDELGSEELEEELEEFYDFTGSTREITERIHDPAQKVAAMLRFFDTDRDEFLGFHELAALYAATTGGQELLEAVYKGACSTTGANPKRGLDVEALSQLYAAGFADLDQHFSVLQDLLAEKLSKGKSSKKTTKAIEEDAEGGGNEEDEEEADEDEDASDDDEDESDAEIVECDDEDEFDEVMRILGLQRATVLDNGDLRLPNGTIAGHRELAYIWRQRGTRMTSANQVALADGLGKPRVRRPKAQLMLSNAPHGMQIALSSREQAREGKRIIAVLRQKQKADMKLGMAQNILQKQKPQKFRTIAGDASGGR